MAEIHRKKLKVILKKLKEIEPDLYLIKMLLGDLQENDSGIANRDMYNILVEKYNDSLHWYKILGIDKIATNRWMLNSRNEIDSREYSKDVDKLYKNVEQLLQDVNNLRLRTMGTRRDILDEKIPEKVKEDLRRASNLPSVPKTNPFGKGGKISIKKSKKRTRTITKNKKTKNKRTKRKI